MLIRLISGLQKTIH